MSRYLLLITLVAGCGTPPPGGGDGGGDGGGSMPDLTNRDDMATAQGANTGAPCAKATDCGGTKPQCVLKDSQGNTWPMGYCSAACNPTQNDPNTGLNIKCPGEGICSGQGATGQCYAACTDMMGGTPCRADYACFNFSEGPICFPASLSECDPNKMLSCPQDGGTFTDPPDGSPDGATAEYSGRVCVQVGQDPVGECHNGCDVFLQNCDIAGGEACIADPDSGASSCSSTSPGKDGDPCFYLNECEPGLVCHDEAMTGVCRFYCGGPKMLGCPMGQTCKDLSMTVLKDKIGICSK